MQGRHPAGGRRVGVGAGLEEVGDHGALAGRVPIVRPRLTDHGRMQRSGAAAIPDLDVGPSRHELPGEAAVVGERRRMQRRVAFVDLGVASGDEELVPAGQARRRQPPPAASGRRAHRTLIVTGVPWPALGVDGRPPVPGPRPGRGLLSARPFPSMVLERT